MRAKDSGTAPGRVPASPEMADPGEGGSGSQSADTQQQAEQQAFLQTVLHEVGAGILIFDPEAGQTIDANERALAMLGLSRDEVLRRSCLESGVSFITHEQQDNVICPDAYAPNGLEEGRLQGADGSVTPVSRRRFLAFLEGRECIVQVFIDITEQKRLERQLGVAQRLESVGMLAAGIAHEINTPIQYISDSVAFIKTAIADLQEILEEYEALEPVLEAAADSHAALAPLHALKEELDLPFLEAELPTACDRAMDGVKRVSRIVQAMKNFSHVGGEEMQAVDLNRALETTLVVAKNEWKYQAEVETDLDAELPLVQCLPGDMNQVFLNMVVNAAHAIQVKRKQGTDGSGSKGRIRISTSRQGEFAAIQIQDDGCGIAPEHLTKVFDPFFTTKEVGKGTGQGLAISHDIVVNKHRGAIVVDSTPGQGTTFTIRLPFLQPDAAAAVGDAP